MATTSRSLTLRLRPSPSGDLDFFGPHSGVRPGPASAIARAGRAAASMITPATRWSWRAAAVPSASS